MESPVEVPQTIESPAEVPQTIESPVDVPQTIESPFAVHQRPAISTAASPDATSCADWATASEERSDLPGL